MPISKPRSPVMANRGERGIRQRRYWEHSVPRRSGLRRSPGLHAFQPSQARSGGTPGGLAVLLVSAVRRRRAVSGRVDWRPRRATRNGRAAVRRNRRAAQRKAALQPSPPPGRSTARSHTQWLDVNRRRFEAECAALFRPTPTGSAWHRSSRNYRNRIIRSEPFKPVRGARLRLKGVADA